MEASELQLHVFILKRFQRLQQKKKQVLKYAESSNIQNLSVTTKQKLAEKRPKQQNNNFNGNVKKQQAGFHLPPTL